MTFEPHPAASSNEAETNTTQQGFGLILGSVVEVSRLVTAETSDSENQLHLGRQGRQASQYLRRVDG
jgi:hypothetical protein